MVAIAPALTIGFIGCPLVQLDSDDGVQGQTGVVYSDSFTNGPVAELLAHERVHKGF